MNFNGQMTAFRLLVILLSGLLGAVVPTILAHPQSYNCDAAKWKPNAPFGHMLVDRLSAVKKASECMIEGVPKQYKPGHKYAVRVSSDTALGHKLVVDQGQLKPDRVKALEAESRLQTATCGYRYKQKTSAYRWVAPSIVSSAKTVTFRAICGQFIGPMYVAQSVISSNAHASIGEKDDIHVDANDAFKADVYL